MVEPAPHIEYLAAPDLTAAITDWQSWLRDERRASAHTCAAYGRDLSQFLNFTAGHLGSAPRLRDLSELRPADFRAWLAARHREGLKPTSTGRALSVLRGFFRWLAKAGLAENAAITTLRTPKTPRSLPKALTPDEAKDVVAATPGLAQEGWIGKRDLAVILLLYGCGLRIGEALNLTRSEAPVPGQTALMVTGKGRKQRVVPLLPVIAEAIQDYLQACPHDLGPDKPLFRGQRGGALNAPSDPATLAGPAAAVGSAGECHTPCPAPFLRHASAGRRRRFAHHPGITRPRLALDNATLYGSRRRGIAGHLR